MAININGLGTSGTSSEKTQSKDGVTKINSKPASSGDSSQANDQVNLSTEAKVLKKVEAQIKSMGDVDQAKIERIKTALRNGEYQIDYDRLASAIQRFESEN